MAMGEGPGSSAPRLLAGLFPPGEQLAGNVSAALREGRSWVHGIE